MKTEGTRDGKFRVDPLHFGCHPYTNGSLYHIYGEVKKFMKEFVLSLPMCYWVEKIISTFMPDYYDTVTKKVAEFKVGGFSFTSLVFNFATSEFHQDCLGTRRG